MRAWQFAKILIITQLCIGLVNGMFLAYDMGDTTRPYFEIVNDSNTQFTIGDIDELGQTTEDGFTGMNTFDMSVGLVISGGLIVWNIIGSMVTIYPTLVNIFHCPPVLAVLIQTGIYLEVAYGVAQWRSGRSGHSIES